LGLGCVKTPLVMRIGGLCRRGGRNPLTIPAYSISRRVREQCPL